MENAKEKPFLSKNFFFKCNKKYQNKHQEKTIV